MSTPHNELCNAVQDRAGTFAEENFVLKENEKQNPCTHTRTDQHGGKVKTPATSQRCETRITDSSRKH